MQALHCSKDSILYASTALFKVVITVIMSTTFKSLEKKCTCLKLRASNSSALPTPTQWCMSSCSQSELHLCFHHDLHSWQPQLLHPFPWQWLLIHYLQQRDSHFYLCIALVAHEPCNSHERCSFPSKSNVPCSR